MELIEQLRKLKVACGFVVNDDDFVFTAWDNMELLDPDTHNREFNKFLKRIKMKTIIPLKNLRHTHTTYFVSTGANIKAVQKRVGHADVITTLGIYAQTNLSEDRKLVNQFEEEFYNKFGLSVSKLYKITSNRFNDEKNS